MRIIAGKYRGRTIAGPPTDQTRPILDRAKVVLFDMLGARLALPGRLPPIAVLDLFAGTGALGMEALSRGARYCRFVEQHRSTIALLRQNLDALHAGAEAEITPGDATVGRFLPPPADETGIAQYNLVFVDPPYRMMQGPRPAQPIQDLLLRIATSEVIAPPAIIVIRHDARGQVSPDLSPLIDFENREVGKMVIRFLARPDVSPREPESVCEKVERVPNRDRKGAESTDAKSPLPDGRGTEKASHTCSDREEPP